MSIAAVTAEGRLAIFVLQPDAHPHPLLARFAPPDWVQFDSFQGAAGDKVSDDEDEPWAELRQVELQVRRGVAKPFAPHECGSIVAGLLRAVISRTSAGLSSRHS
jgi:hypothetical protein